MKINSTDMITAVKIIKEFCSTHTCGECPLKERGRKCPSQEKITPEYWNIPEEQ